MQRGASAITAAADAPISAFFISSSSPDPLMAAVSSPLQIQFRTFVMRSYEWPSVSRQPVFAPLHIFVIGQVGDPQQLARVRVICLGRGLG